jgi:uncharacterized protein
MSRSRIILICSLAATIPGTAARAGAGPRVTDEPGEVRIDKEAVRHLLTPAHQVSVVGTAKVSVVPDVAHVSLGVTTSRPTALEAVEDNNLSMTKLVDALKARGVAAKDIQTSQISIAPQYSRPPAPRPGVPVESTVPRVVGYEVANTVRVTVRDRAKLGDLLDASVKAGSNQIHGISFSIDDREAVLEGLRTRAFDAARRKSEIYATRSGMELGPVLQITEADPSWSHSPQPMAFETFGRAMAPAPMAPSMPVSAGEQEVSLSVTVSFELKLPK